MTTEREVSQEKEKINDLESLDVNNSESDTSSKSDSESSQLDNESTGLNTHEEEEDFVSPSSEKHESSESVKKSNEVPNESIKSETTHNHNDTVSNDSSDSDALEKEKIKKQESLDDNSSQPNSPSKNDSKSSLLDTENNKLNSDSVKENPKSSVSDKDSGSSDTVKKFNEVPTESIKDDIQSEADNDLDKSESEEDNDLDESESDDSIDSDVSDSANPPDLDLEEPVAFKEEFSDDDSEGELQSEVNKELLGSNNDTRKENIAEEKADNKNITPDSSLNATEKSEIPNGSSFQINNDETQSVIDSTAQKREISEVNKVSDKKDELSKSNSESTEKETVNNKGASLNTPVKSEHDHEHEHEKEIVDTESSETLPEKNEFIKKPSDDSTHIKAEADVPLSSDSQNNDDMSNILGEDSLRKIYQAFQETSDILKIPNTSEPSNKFQELIDNINGFLKSCEERISDIELEKKNLLQKEKDDRQREENLRLEEEKKRLKEEEEKRLKEEEEKRIKEEEEKRLKEEEEKRIKEEKKKQEEEELARKREEEEKARKEKEKQRIDTINNSTTWLKDIKADSLRDYISYIYSDEYELPENVFDYITAVTNRHFAAVDGITNEVNGTALDTSVISTSSESNSLEKMLSDSRTVLNESIKQLSSVASFSNDSKKMNSELENLACVLSGIERNKSDDAFHLRPIPVGLLSLDEDLSKKYKEVRDHIKNAEETLLSKHLSYSKVSGIGYEKLRILAQVISFKLKEQQKRIQKLAELGEKLESLSIQSADDDNMVMYSVEDLSLAKQRFFKKCMEQFHNRSVESITTVVDE